MLLPHETQQRAPRWLEAPSRRTHPDHPSSASSTSPRPPNAFQAAQPPLKASTPPRTAVTREAQPTQPSSTTTRDRHTPMEEAIRAAVVEEFAQQPHMAPQQPDQPAAMQAADNAIGSLVPLAVAHAINQHQRHAAQPGVLGGVKVLQGHGQQQRVWVALYEAEAGEVEFWGSYQNEQAAKQAYNAAALYHNLGGDDCTLLAVHPRVSAGVMAVVDEHFFG